jgi:hypothetical protein
MKAWLVAVSTLFTVAIPTGALAQAPEGEAPLPPPPLPPPPLSPSAQPAAQVPVQSAEIARVRLKSSVSGVHLIDATTKQKACFLNCERGFSVYTRVARMTRYDLVEENGRTLVSDLEFPPSATGLVLEYSGRMPGLLAPGIVATVIGGASIVVGIGVLLVTAFFILVGGGTSATYLAVYSLPFLGGGALMLVPGIIMTALGARQRHEIKPDDEPAVGPPVAPTPPPAAPAVP